MAGVAPVLSSVWIDVFICMETYPQMFECFVYLLLFIHSNAACANEIGESDVDGFYMGDNEAIHWQPVTYVPGKI